MSDCSHQLVRVKEVLIRAEENRHEAVVLCSGETLREKGRHTCSALWEQGWDGAPWEQGWDGALWEQGWDGALWEQGCAVRITRGKAVQIK